MRVEVGPTAEKLFTRLPVELTCVFFQKHCRARVCASSFIISLIKALFIVVVGLLDLLLLPVAPKQSLHGEECFFSNFFFGVLVGSFCELYV